MSQKKLWVLGVLGIFVIIIAAVYWLFFSKPDTFPVKKQLIEEMNSVFPEAEANVIQNTLFMDEQHVLVPFISKNNHYGLSYWVWKNHKWRMVSVDTKGEPRIWEINRKDPSTFRVVWNMDPNDHQSYIKFYFIRDRNFLVTGEEQTYYPRIQMEKKVLFTEKSYGAMKLPRHWSQVMNELGKMQSQKQTGISLFNETNYEQYFGWASFNMQAKEMFPQGSMSGDGYSNGDENISFIRFIDQTELE